VVPDGHRPAILQRDRFRRRGSAGRDLLSQQCGNGDLDATERTGVLRDARIRADTHHERRTWFRNGSDATHGDGFAQADNECELSACGFDPGRRDAVTLLEGLIADAEPFERCGSSQVDLSNAVLHMPLYGNGRFPAAMFRPALISAVLGPVPGLVTINPQGVG